MADSIKKNYIVLLFNPPGQILIRGEGRSDSETDPDKSVAAAKWIYPPMNLAYGASYLRPAGFHPIIRDYPAEGTPRPEFIKDVQKIKPEVCLANLNPSSEADDLWAMRQIRFLFPACKIIAFAPYLALYEPHEIDSKFFPLINAVLTAERMELAVPLARALLAQEPAQLDAIPGIIFKPAGAGRPRKTAGPPPTDFSDPILPARDLLKNQLYVRPDNGRSQALIQAGRGCPFKCKFCLTPKMTGVAYALRPVENLMAEIRECVEKYGITQFFFRADTFTVNKEWSKRFAQAIIDNQFKIAWCANSRSNCFDEELAKLFKRSGCWLLAFGFESGALETLQKCGKGTTVEQNELARKLCRKNGILVHGQYIIGFPWEGEEHLRQTYAHIRRMQCDFVDVQLLVPYVGTDIYNEIKSKYPELLAEKVGSKISGGIKGTAQGVSRDDLLRFQKKILLANYLNIRSIFRLLLRLRSWAELRNYARHGGKFIANILTR